MIRLTNVLVATDFSEPARIALEYGRELARQFGATLHLLHVVPNLAAIVSPEYYPTLLPAAQKELEDAAGQNLALLLAEDVRLHGQAHGVVRTSAATAAAIVDYTRDAHIDVIVIGTHGRGGVSHFFMGSVAERVVRTAPCPVLTVRHPEREFVSPDATRDLAQAPLPGA